MKMEIGNVVHDDFDYDCGYLFHPDYVDQNHDGIVVIVVEMKMHRTME